MAKTQKKSVANINGLEGRSHLIAKIYFPYDSSELDENDRELLQFLSRHFGRLLPQKRAEFSFYGHADYRGAAIYNERLGKRRAEAVQRYFDSLMNQHTNYTSWRAISRGESLAVQGNPTQDQMAEDRRVEIYCTLTNNPLPVPPPKPPDIVRVMVNRFYHRGFWQMQAQANSQNTDPSSLKEGVAGLIKIIKGLADPEAVLGSELATARKTGLVNAAYRVNKVVCDVRVDLSMAGPGTVTNTFTDFDYDWGPPLPQVVFESSYTPTIFEQKHQIQKTTNTISRQEADSNPLIFPPDPEKRPLRKN